MDCIFCKIINKEVPADVVYEDENAVAFLDIRPVSRGHILVVPKTHTENILVATDETLAETMKVVKKVAHAVLEVTHADAFNLGVNTGEASGQAVFHTHFHIIPRFGKDGLQPWPHQESESKARAELAEEIKKHL